ncbi:MAG TPA: hypothetical protein VMW04_04075 [Patescibacteria group bacterium]|nr:hypothetical protein [Patescibacteria group bacterium]
MSKIFYDHLIKIEEVIVELEGHQLEDGEKEELISLIDDTFHHQTLNLILSHLSSGQQENFLTRFNEAPYDPDLLNFLKETITDDVEEMIKKEAEKIKKEILSDIKKSQRK